LPGDTYFTEGGKMGMLIPNTYDQQVLTQLTMAFAPGSAGIDVLRAHNKKEPLFDTNHSLERVAYRIGAVPTNDATNPNVQGKWYGLLSHIDTQVPQTRDTIKGYLQAALTNANRAISSVQFDAFHDTTIQEYSVAFSQPSAGVYKLTLRCPNDPYQGAVKPAGYVPPPDTDPSGNPVEVAPTTIWPKARRPRRAKKAAKKQARRKSARTKAGGITRKTRTGRGKARKR
jgi:hypothetical protein